jgi:hypothetical protein
MKKAMAAQVSCIEGTLRFPQRGKLARLEAPLSSSLGSRNHARSASSHGLLPQLTFAGQIRGNAACLRIIQPEPSEEDGALRPPIGAGSQALFKAAIQSARNLGCFLLCAFN